MSRHDGALAQLGEHLLCKQGVVGSIPTGSTSLGGMWNDSAHKLSDTGSEAGVVIFENMGRSERLRRNCLQHVS